MSLRHPGVAALVVIVGLALAGTARAQTLSFQDPDRLPNWKIGSAAFTAGAPDRSERLADLHQKYRVGGSLLPWLEPYATLRPWIGVGRSPDGTRQGMGGVLADVPIGSTSFVFTPSVGAGGYTNSFKRDSAGVEFRSQVELGYEFDNQSRVTLGFSRTVGGDAGDGRTDSNIIGFTYRLPFGALTGR